MGESAGNVASLVRSLNSFNGTPGEFREWKRKTTAVIGLSNKRIAKIVAGQQRPTPRYVVEDTPAGVRQPRAVGLQEEQQLQHELEGPEDRSSPSRRLAGIFGIRASSAGLSDRASERGGPPPATPPTNAREIELWDQDNEDLYNLLYLTTSGSAACLLRRFEAKERTTCKRAGRLGSSRRQVRE